MQCRSAIRPLLSTLLVGIASFVIPHTALAQADNEGGSKEQQGTALITDEFQGGVHIHTQGLGVTVRKGRYRTAKRLAFIGGDVVYLRNAKEEKTSNPVYDDGRQYVYGKANAFHIVRLYIGRQTVHARKLREEGVRVATTWKLGATAGILKPVYLLIGYPEIPYEYLATERYDPAVHYSDDIYGLAPWLNGLDELKVVPGLHGSIGLDFEYGDDAEIMRSLQVGMAVDAFFEKPEILADQFDQNRRIFVTLYAQFEVGRRWSR
jgi:hypothetical protein